MNASNVGVVLGAASIVLSLIIAYRARRPRRLDYQITSDTRLLASTPYTTSGDLVVNYRQKKLVDPRLVVVRLINSGKTAISPDDFVGQLTISAGSGSIMTHGIAATNPELLAAELEENVNSVALRPLLLNAGEWVEVQLLIDGSVDPIVVGGRIAGVTIRRTDRGARSLSRRQLVGWLGSRWLEPAAFAAAAATAVAVLVLNPRDETKVPDLHGKPVYEAIVILRSQGLHLENQITVPTDGSTGIVIDQLPGAGVKVSRGSGVSLTVSGGRR